MHAESTDRASTERFVRHPVARMVVGGAIYAVRLVLFSILAFLEPFVRVVLSLATLGALASCVIYHFSSHATHFPMAAMLMVSAGLPVILVLYYMLLRALAP